MGHASQEELLDLAEVLSQVRELPALSERSPGVFYFKRIPFMHFHTKDGKRWADVKLGKTWGPELAIPFDSGARAKQQFLKQVSERYRALVAHHAPARAPKKPL